jgi:DNA-binding transcriptional regulator YiaG
MVARRPRLALVDFDELLLIGQARNDLQDGTARELREAFGLKLSEVARAVDCDTTTLARWENADRRMEGGELGLRYARFLDQLRRQAAEREAS